MGFVSHNFKIEEQKKVPAARPKNPQQIEIKTKQFLKLAEIPLSLRPAISLIVQCAYSIIISSLMTYTYEHEQVWNILQYSRVLSNRIVNKRFERNSIRCLCIYFCTNSRIRLKAVTAIRSHSMNRFIDRILTESLWI